MSAKLQPFFFFLLILTLTVSACGGESADTQPDQPSGGQQTSPPEEPASGGEGASRSSETGAYADLDVLDSYRMEVKTAMVTEGGPGWGGDQTMEVKWDKETQAKHIATHDASGNVTTEMFTIGDVTWFNVGTGWIQSPPDTTASATTVDIVSIVPDIQSGMTVLGEETVNGVHCKHYHVDADFTIEMAIFEGEGPQEVGGHILGEMWMADQSGMPAVVIRARVEIQIGGFGDQMMTIYEQRDVYDIGVPVAIEPPSDAVTMSSPPAGASSPPEDQPPAPPAGQTDAPLDLVDLERLDSYHLEVTYQVQRDEDLMVQADFTEEWVRELPARRITVSYGPDMPVMAYIFVGDSTWLDVGGTWTEVFDADIQDVESVLTDLTTPDPGMTLVGEETVNGIRCKHYAQDVETASQSIHHEMWVADQDDLPPVVIRSLYRLEFVQGDLQMVTEGEVNVTQINGPITIEPPQ